MSKRVAYSFPPLYEGGKPSNYLEYWDRSSYFCMECGTKNLWERNYYGANDHQHDFFCTACGTAISVLDGVYTAPNTRVHKARTEQLLKED